MTGKSGSIAKTAFALSPDPRECANNASLMALICSRLNRRQSFRRVAERRPLDSDDVDGATPVAQRHHDGERPAWIICLYFADRDHRVPATTFGWAPGFVWDGDSGIDEVQLLPDMAR